MREAFSRACFAFAGVSVALVYELPVGSPAVLAPLAVVALFAPLGALLWPTYREPVPHSIPLAFHAATIWKPEQPPQPPAAIQKTGSVARFMAEHLTRAEGQSVRVDDLLKVYTSCCEAKDLSALGADEFQQRLDELCEAAGISRGEGGSIANVMLAG